jgi:hypothetical protein
MRNNRKKGAKKMNLLSKRLIAFFVILGIVFGYAFLVNNNSYSVKGATITSTPARRVTPTPTRRVTPTPTRRVTPTPRFIFRPTIPTGVNITFYIEKVSDTSEGSTSMGRFRLWATQSGPLTFDGYVDVNYTIGGTATNGVDYLGEHFHPLTGTISVSIGNPPPYPTGHEHDNLYVDASTDDLIEGTETVIITLTGVTVGAGQGSATLNITDSVSTITPTPTRPVTPTPTVGIILNPTIPPGVTITYYVEARGDTAEPTSGTYGTMTSFRFWSTQTGPSTSNGYFKVNYTISGTASYADYTIPNPGYSGLQGYVWVRVGNSPAPPLPSDTFIDGIYIMPLRDNLVEGTETLTLTLTGVNVGPGKGSATINILDANSATTPTPTPAPTPTPDPGGYAVSYAIQSDWGNGATVNVTITNNSSMAVSGWTMAWTFPGNQTISNMWNATFTQTGASVSAKDAGFNAIIPANGGSVNFGFNLNYSGSNAKPTSFTLNGTPCLVQ